MRKEEGMMSNAVQKTKDEVIVEKKYFLEKYGDIVVGEMLCLFVSREVGRQSYFSIAEV
jgi:hypothetical protein